jgi:arylsulfatase A-like enzyme
MIGTIDFGWLQRNAPQLLDAAASEAGVEFVRGQEFLDQVKDLEKPNLDNRELFRGVFDGRYKLVRYFGLAHYNLPDTVGALLANNDVALYDLQKDPEEMDNLADPKNPGFDRDLLETMNAKLNTLIKKEIGVDEPILRPQV